MMSQYGRGARALPGPRNAPIFRGGYQIDVYATLPRSCSWLTCSGNSCGRPVRYNKSSSWAQSDHARGSAQPPRTPAQGGPPKRGLLVVSDFSAYGATNVMILTQIVGAHFRWP